MGDSVERWLSNLGLEQYAGLFADSHISTDELPDLTDDDLRELDVAPDHRRVIMAQLEHESSAAPTEITDAEFSAERRQVTVMYCDLVGSTALGEHFDAEQMHDIVNAYRDTCTEVVNRYGGTVARYLGDGMQVFFGYPLADEHDAERAVRAGLDIVERVAQLRPRENLVLRNRVGIATGKLVIGNFSGAGFSQELSATGATLTLAEGLEANATAGTVLISQGTRRLCAGLFEMVDCGDVEMRNIGSTARAYRVVSALQHSARSTAGAAQMSGRDDELAALTSLWAEATAGTSKSMLLTGEPGVGKSRLVESLRDAAASAAPTELRLFGAAHHQGSPLQPVADFLNDYLQLGRTVQDTNILQILRALVAELKLEDKFSVALIAHTLGVSLDEHPEHLPLLSPEHLQTRTLGVLTSVLTTIGAGRPKLLIVEDLHWFDPTSIALVSQLSGSLEGSATLMVMTARPDFQAPWAEDAVSTMPLDRLSNEAAARLVEAHAAGALSGELCAQIVQTADGIPLFIEELTRATVSELSEDGIAVGVPSSLHDALMARLDKAGKAKFVAQTAASLGRSFHYPVLAAVTPSGEAQLRGALDTLVDLDILNAEGVAPDITYRFRHALLQETAYSSLLRRDRRAVHLRIAQTLERYFPNLVQSEPATIAHHFRSAEQSAQAIPYWHRSARSAMALAAYPQATQYLRNALVDISAIEDAAARDASELSLLVDLGTCLTPQIGYAAPELAETYSRARELCERQSASSEQFTVLLGFFRFYVMRAQYAECTEVASECLALAEQLGNPGLRIEAHTALVYCHAFTGRYDEAIAEATLCLQLDAAHERDNLQFVAPQDPIVATLAMLASIQAMRGDVAEGAATAARALTLAETLNQPFTYGFILAYISQLEQLRGNYTAAIEAIQKMLASAAEYGIDAWSLLGTIHISASQTALGDDTGLENLQTYIGVWQSFGAENSIGYFKYCEAEGLLACGRNVEALSAVYTGLEHANSTGEHLFHAALLEVKARILAAIDAEDAHTTFMEALHRATEDGLELLRMRAMSGALRIRDDDKLRADLAACCERLVGETVHLDDARALL